jgi:hypothetical protein
MACLSYFLSLIVGKLTFVSVLKVFLMIFAFQFVTYLKRNDRKSAAILRFFHVQVYLLILINLKMSNY